LKSTSRTSSMFRRNCKHHGCKRHCQQRVKPQLSSCSLAVVFGRLMRCSQQQQSR
jgi:hypothetical protein